MPFLTENLPPRRCADAGRTRLAPSPAKAARAEFGVAKSPPHLAMALPHWQCADAAKKCDRGGTRTRNLLFARQHSCITSLGCRERPEDRRLILPLGNEPFPILGHTAASFLRKQGARESLGI